MATKEPKKFNIVSLMIYGAIAAGIYWLVMFGPVYWRRYQAKGILDDYVNKLLSKRGITDAQVRLTLARSFEEEAMRRMKSEAGISDPTLRVRFRSTPAAADGSAQYREVIRHPVLLKPTQMIMRPYVSSKNEKSMW